MHYLRHILFFCCAVPVTAFALSLGEPSGQAVIGRPLALKVPLGGGDAARLTADCVRILPVTHEASNAGLKSALVWIENGSIIITTGRALYDPVLSFRLRVDCGFQIERDYLLLPSPPESVMPETAPTQTRVSPPPEPGMAAIAPTQAPLILQATPPQPAQPTSGRDFVVPEQTTLRLMSRKRYPTDPRARVAFIRRVAAANPDKFDSTEVAFDKPLTAGAQLRLPEDLPRQRPAAASAVAPGPAVKLAPRERARSAGKGRLIIGSDTPSDKSVTELKADVDRLVKAMGDQVRIQDSMTERLKVLTEEASQAKQTAALLKTVNERIETDIRELREEQKHNSYIQLALAILVGGFAVTSFLLWRDRERRSTAKPPSYPLY